MRRSRFVRTWWAGVLCVAAALAVARPAHAAEGKEAGAFRSAWPSGVMRVWAGPEYWTNALHHWRVADGRLECTGPGSDRNVHLLTRQLGEGKGDLKMSVRLGAIEPDKAKAAGGWAGFRIGAIGSQRDHRDSARRGQGIEAGLTTDGELFIGGPPGGGNGGGPAPAPKPVAHRGLPRDKWQIVFCDSEETDGENCRVINLLDGRADTIWHSQYKAKRVPYPHEIQIDLGGEHEVCGLALLPRQGNEGGRIKDYEVYVGADRKDWGVPAAAGALANSEDMQEVRFEPRRGRYVRLVAKTGQAARPAAALAELYVLDTATRDAKPQAAPPESKAAKGKKAAPKAAEPAPAQADDADAKAAGTNGAIPLDDVELRAAAEPAGEAYRLTLAAHDPKTGAKLGEVSRTFPAERLVGNLVLVCDAGGGAGGRGKAARGTGPAAPAGAGFWFRDWAVAGAKVEAHDEHAFGPVLWAQWTLSRRVLKMAAQMPPLGEADGKTVRLQVRDGGDWREIATAEIDPLARTATFRIAGWDDQRDVPYRVAYGLIGPDGKPRDHYFAGTVRRDPVDKKTITIAAFTGNADYNFPNLDLVKHVAAHDPDVLFFSGDNIYENVGGYGIVRQPLDVATLDYLRKWYYFGWAYRDLIRDRPTISIPDDHDVYQGNLWGQGGRKCPGGINTGGYSMDAEWVKMVERTQTSNLPDPFDPTPVEQGIGVYYTNMTYGRVSFAILEDRKFKTGPEGVVPPTKGRSDHVSDPDFDVRSADVPGAKLLGDRQLHFLAVWAADWRGADFKAALSQTVFANAATLHGGGLQRLIADYDSNGWPQAGRNKALAALQKAFAVMIGGDQHLATLIHHGVEAWNDAGWSLCVPSVCNFYPRAWVPLKPAHDWKAGMAEHTGEFLDPFGNRITMYAHTNPRPMGHDPASIHDKMPGYGIARFHKDTRKITFECWPLFADPRDPKTGSQYEGWPRTVDQLDNYARKPAGWLPPIEVQGLADPVVQVIREAGGEIVYTLRVRGTSFQPWVFEEGSYTVKVGEQEPERIKTLEHLKAEKTKDQKPLTVSF